MVRGRTCNCFAACLNVRLGFDADSVVDGIDFGHRARELDLRVRALGYESPVTHNTGGFRNSWPRGELSRAASSRI